ncbi:HAMP domain-containing protein [Streptomyces sp. NEAU-174]|uniref:HAMP domain-containing protein n=1 Tax=Streptomyces sp. NEAU-174 TaxID=3458254 RepID=UPI0040447206
MRRRLLLLTGATTALVLAALLVPLTLLTRTHVADRSTAEATARAQWVASAVGPVLASGAQVAKGAEETVRSARGAGLPRTSLILADGAVAGAPAQITNAVGLARTGRAFTYAPSDGGRVVLVPVHGAPDGTAVVQVALSPGQLHDGVIASWLVLAGIGAGLVLLGLLLADRLGARLVGATRSLAKTADRLAAGDLTARAEPAGPPELRLIGDQLNRLAARIDELLAAERENAADLAHRLRTPVAALRLDAETLGDPTPSGPLRVPAPHDALAAALDALIGNVLDHTPQGTGFRVTVRAAGDTAELLVEDEGPGFHFGGAGPIPPCAASAARVRPGSAWTSPAVPRMRPAARSQRGVRRGRG